MVVCDENTSSGERRRGTRLFVGRVDSKANGKLKPRSIAQPARRTDVSAHALDESFTNRKSKTRPAIDSRRRTFGLCERIEQLQHGVGANADPCIRHFK